MARQSEDPIPPTERTDELPVLSGEAIRRLEAARPKPDDALTQGLDDSLEALRAALDRAEERWLRLETRLEQQDRAIARLQAELFTRSVFRGGNERTLLRVPELTEVVTALPPDDSPAAASPPATTVSATATPAPESPAAETPAAGTPADQASEAAGPSGQFFLERIADLEAYIAGRADRWRAMEADLESNARRIAELESELEQRIAREQALTDRLHAAGDRSNGLKDQLQRMHLRLESLEGGSD